MTEPPADADGPAWGDFLARPENQSAVRAAKTLARSLGRTPARVPFAPLVLHGPTGSGKTHLAAQLLRHLARGSAVVTARVAAAGDLARPSGAAGEPDGFADPDLRACDVLVLEDVQHLSPRAAADAGDLLDRRAARRRATVVTANAGPATLNRLPQQFTSRLAGGLVVRMEPLGVESRRAVLAAAAAARRVTFTPDALNLLAGSGGGLRAALGLVASLARIAPGFPGPLDRPAVEQVLAGTGQPTSAGPTVPDIVRRVAAAFGVSEKELLGPSRLRRVLVPRQVAMFLVRELTGMSLPRIGTAFGGRDHTTVLHACRKVAAQLDADERLAGAVRQLRSEAA